MRALPPNSVALPGTSQTRSKVKSLQHELAQRLAEMQSRRSGICPKRETLYVNIFAQLIEQVEVMSPDSGAILSSLKNERTVSLACHLELHRNATELGTREAMAADSAVSALSRRYELLLAEITALKFKASSLQHHIRLIEDAASHARAIEDRVKAEEIEAHQLSQHLFSHKPGFRGGNECAQQ